MLQQLVRYPVVHVFNVCHNGSDPALDASDGEPGQACYHGTIMKFTVILSPEAEGGYSVICPAIPGCVSQGNSLEETLANIREAILLCLEVRKDESLPLPVETPEVVAGEIHVCLRDRAEEGLPLTIETREVEVEAEVAV